MHDTTSCPGIIRLNKPIDRQRSADCFPRFSQTVFIYECPVCKNHVKVKANSFVGKTPIPDTGAIRCTH